MRYFILLLALSSCGTFYSTTCNMRMQGDWYSGELTERFNYKDIQLMEDMAIKYGLVRCEDLYDVTIVTHREAWYLPRSQVLAAGAAYCPERRIEIVAPEVIPHELHHISQNCNPGVAVDEGADPSHADWYRTGAYQRIQMAVEEFYDYKAGEP